jgi:site-specific DNA-cytosine methylase
MRRELVVDSFAGGGGASLGITAAIGRGPDIAINHDAAAIAMHAANHPETRHITEDVFRASPRKVTRGRPVGLLWASPDCRHFSRAKGGKPVEKRIRGLAWSVIKWAVEAQPRIIVLENVREFEDWGPLLPLWRCRRCDWSGTEGQATLSRRGRHRCPRCDSSALIVTEQLVPDPARKGLTFRRFVGRLRNLGYRVEWKVSNWPDSSRIPNTAILPASHCDSGVRSRPKSGRATGPSVPMSATPTIGTQEISTASTVGVSSSGSEAARREVAEPEQNYTDGRPCGLSI